MILINWFLKMKPTIYLFIDLDRSRSRSRSISCALKVKKQKCLELCFPRACSVRYVPRHTAGITGTGHLGKIGTTSIPVPDTLVSSARHRYRHRRYRYGLSYRYQTLQEVRYNINTGTGHFDQFGTTSVPVPDTSGSLVQHRYRYRTLR